MTMVEASKKAPRRADGTFLYVVEAHSWGRTTTRLVAAVSLQQAKSEHGWTRNRYETRRVHRASVEEVAAFPKHAIPPVGNES